MHTTGQQLYHGRFTLVAPIGRGGSGMVWEARDAQTGNLVAIKLLIADAGGLAAVEREAEAAVRVRHPNAVRVLLTFEDADVAGVVMERCVASAADRVAAHGPVAPDDAVRMIAAVLAALTAAHAAGVVHRDIKPANILLRADGSAALSDWGIARALFGSGVTHTTSIALLGTLPYLAPELRQDPRAASPATDLYAVGITLAWLLTGKVPPDPFVPAGEAAIRAALPAGLADVVLRACAWEPAERYASAAEMAGGLAGALDAQEVREVRAVVRKATVRRPMWLGAVVLGLGVGWAGWEVRGVSEIEGAEGGTNEPGVKEELPWCDVSARGFAGPTAPGPRETLAAAAADLDLDGVMDAIFTNQLDESVTVWWGPFTLDARQDIPTGRSAVAPMVYDVDGDGHLDLIAPLSDDAAFAVVRGLGARRFAAPDRVMQGPGPRNARIVSAREGVTALFLAGGQLLSRVITADLRWPTHRALLDVPMLVKGTVAVDGDDIWVALYGSTQSLIRLDRDLTVREQHSVTWPKLALAFAADLAPPAGDELYGQLADGQVIRLPRNPEEAACAVTPVGAMVLPGVVMQLDDDGVPDIVMADTCAECTSSQIIRFGVLNAFVVGQ